MELRPFQKQALKVLAKPVHLVCVAPTGAGKSLIFQKIAARPGMRTLLVTPLIALSRQQGNRLIEYGVRVSVSVSGSGRGPPEAPHHPTAWVVSPEKFFAPEKERSLEKLAAWEPNFLVVDEAHCLWEWGDEFRPAFGDLPSLIRRFQIPRSLWLTATLPKEAKENLMSLLPRKNTRQLGNFQIPSNLQLRALKVPWPDRADAMMAWVKSQREAGIIFSPTRETTRRLHRLLKSGGVPSAIYHAGMSQEERINVEAAIKRKEIPTIIATSAFGMGMDHAHLKWALHWQAPFSLLNLAQAIGRVGRGEGTSKSILLWDDSDFELNEWALRGKEKNRNALLQVANFLRSKRCRKRVLTEYFEGSVSVPECGSCDRCENQLRIGTAFA